MQRLVHSSLPLETASCIIAAVLALRRQHGMHPLAVAVLDAGGLLVAFQREDGCSTMRADIALAKAAGALGVGMNSRLLTEKLASRPAFCNAMNGISGGRFAPVPGGVLLLDRSGSAIGAVGVTGDSGDMDEWFAVAAIQQAIEAAALDTRSPVVGSDPAAAATKDPRSKL